MQCAESLDEVVLDHDAGLPQVLDLLEQRGGVDDHAVAEEAELGRMDDAGGDEPEGEVLSANFTVWPALWPP